MQNDATNTGLSFEEGAMDWSSLEKNLGGNLNKKTKYKADERMWKLSRDDNDMGTAVIRLIPDPNGIPLISRFSHTFSSFDNMNKKKRFYIKTSPQTIEEPCPVSELWSAIYNIGTEDSLKEARNFGRKIKYMTNIKVIKDPLNPQNEGKIFLWEFGTKLNDKFQAALKPSDTELKMGEKPKQLYDVFVGHNIKLKIKKASGFFNYDDTEIMETSSIYDSKDFARDDIINNAHILDEFRVPEAFETYVELKKTMKYVLDAYKPEFIDEETFKQVVNKVLNVESTETKEEVKNTVSQPTQPTQNESPPTSVTEDDDATFLEGL